MSDATPTSGTLLIPPPPRPANQDPLWVRVLLIGMAVGAMTVLVIIPVVNVFWQALSPGIGSYLRTLTEDPDTLHSILLTLTVTPLAVLLNTAFGIVAAWTVTRFRFFGRTLLVTLIDLPISVSPVVAGLVFVLLFGTGGWFHTPGVRVLFSTPGLILATTFITLPLVVRELIPVMEAIGMDEEIAAVSLGASPWEIFRRVTLPNIRWGLLYGIILCNARAMGEFGAVYVVSGHIAGQTNTMPLQIEQMFQGFNTPGAFAVASLLTVLAAVTLVLKVIVEEKSRKLIRDAKKVDVPG